MSGSNIRVLSFRGDSLLEIQWQIPFDRLSVPSLEKLTILQCNLPLLAKSVAAFVRRHRCLTTLKFDHFLHIPRDLPASIQKSFSKITPLIINAWFDSIPPPHGPLAEPLYPVDYGGK